MEHIMASTSTTSRRKAAAKQATAMRVYPVRSSKEDPKTESVKALFGRSLGLKVKSRKVLIREIKKGLEVSRLRHLSKEINIQERELAKFAAIPPRTLARRKEIGRLSSDESDRLTRISMLFDEAVNLFDGDRAKASSWFLSPKKALGGSSPIEFSETEPGTLEVRDLIGRIEHGVFS
jgi:putative toxin-antitoxin system antitoxin component (TIGR02293 family)